jgi:uncharacterized protein (DUF1778 family)
MATLPLITARVDADTWKLLSQAAAIVGMPDINSFVLSAAVEKAKKIVERDVSLTLSRRDAMMFVNALDVPPEVNLRLQQAAKNYKTKSQL